MLSLVERQLAAQEEEDRTRDELKSRLERYIARARGCKLEWAEEARVLRRHNARAGQRISDVESVEK